MYPGTSTDHSQLRHHRVGRWIEQQSVLQQIHPSGYPRAPDGSPIIGTTPNPYLAYPQLRHRGQQDVDEETVESYVFLDQQDASVERESGIRPHDQSSSQRHASSSLNPLIRTLSKMHVRSRSDMTSERPYQRNTPAPQRAGSRITPSPRHDADVLSDSASTHTNPTSWKFPRVGHHQGMSSSHSLSRSTDMSTISRAAHHSRPSTSSDRTFRSQSSITIHSGSAATTTAEKRSVFSTNTASKTTLSKKTSRIFKSSSPSLFSLPVLSNNTPRDEVLLTHKQSFIRRPFSSLKPSAPNPSVSSGSNLLGRPNSKQKTLVISGVAVDDSRKLEGVKRWCESFGEIRKMTRTRAGDLHIHFKRPDVADTVCRVRATVNIAGVGSVALSWYRGKSPP